MKILLISLIFVALVWSSNASLSFRCTYGESRHTSGSESVMINVCFSENFPTILEPNTELSAPLEPIAFGLFSLTYQAFILEDPRISVLYFPQGLERFFGRHGFIKISKVQMKEIHQSDLQPFTELEFLILNNNNIEDIEKDLFKFNTKLYHLDLQQNKLSFVHPHAFYNLNSLEDLWFGGNICIDENSQTREEVLNLIQKVKQPCSYLQHYLRAKKEIEKDESKPNSCGMKSNCQIKSTAAAYEEVIKNEIKLSIEESEKSIESAIELIKNKIINFFETSDGKISEITSKLNNEVTILKEENGKIVNEMETLKKENSNFKLESDKAISKKFGLVDNVLGKLKDEITNSQRENEVTRKESEKVISDKMDELKMHQKIEMEKVLKTINDTIEATKDKEDMSSFFNTLMTQNVSIIFVIPLVCMLALINVGIFIACYKKKRTGNENYEMVFTKRQRAP